MCAELPATANVSETDGLLANNGLYSDAFEWSGIGPRPIRRAAIITCMDARLNPQTMLGLQEGDANIIRNAGAVVGDSEIRSIAVSQHELGTREILLIAHTDCGMMSLDEEDFARRLERDAGSRPSWAIHAFKDLEDHVRREKAKLVHSRFIPFRDAVNGFIYDVRTGALTEVS